MKKTFRKVLCVAISILMINVPITALAEEKQENEGASKSKTFELEGVTYNDIYYGKTRRELEDADAKALKEMFKDVLTYNNGNGNVMQNVWVPTAIEGLKGNDAYQVRSASKPRNFNEAFVKNKYTAVTVTGNNGDINKKWGDDDHFHYASGFSGLENDIYDNLLANSKYIKSGLDKKKDAYTSAITFPTSGRYAMPDFDGDVYYNMYSNVVSYGKKVGSGNGGCIYNSFVIAYYDFQVTPLDDVDCVLKNYQNEEEPAKAAVNAGEKDVTYKEISEKELTKTSTINESSSPISYCVEAKKSSTSLIENSMSVGKEVTFGQSINVGYTFAAGAMEAAFAKHSISVDLNFSFSEMYSTEKSTTTSSSKSEEHTWNVSGELPPATQVLVSQSKNTMQATSKYSCPVKYSYKVAVISVCGDYSTNLPYEKVKPKFTGVAASFGTSKTNAGDALADLCYRRSNTMYETNRINWNNVLIKEENKGSLYTPASKFGGKITYNIETNSSTVSPITALYPLEETKVKQSEYELHIKKDVDDINENTNRLNLSDIEVFGYSSGANKSKVDYYGFDKDNGYWTFCDEKGTDISDEKNAEIINSTNASFLEGIKEGTVYLRYHIDENIYPKDTKNPEKGYLTDLVKNARIKVDIIEDDFVGKLEAFAPEDGIVMELSKDENTGLKQAMLHLCDVDGLECVAYDKTGKRLSSAVQYHWQNAGSGANFKVDDDGMATATAVGTYQIQAYCQGVVSNKIDVKVVEKDEIMTVSLEDTSTDEENVLTDGELLSNGEFYLDKYEPLILTVEKGDASVSYQWNTFEEMEENGNLYFDYENASGEREGMTIEDGIIVRADPGEYEIFAVFEGVRSNSIKVVV